MSENIDQAAIVVSCTKLFVDYGRHVDFGDYDKFVDLFAEDASLDLGFKLEGKDKIRRSMSKRSDELRSRHVLSNISIDVESETTAQGIAYLSLYRHIGPESLADAPVSLTGPAAVGHYSSRFKLTNEGWRIAACSLEFAFKDDAQFPPI
jgi:hypothetical protein